MSDVTTARILRVNHAGEYGAVRIYSAQLFVSKKIYPDLVPFLERTLADEVRHCEKFAHAMKPRDAKPCYTMGLWSSGGWLLGFITALMGRNAVMICTAAVERVVHEHLKEQMRYLDGKDAELRSIILDIEKEEIEHLDFAQSNLKQSFLVKPLSALIKASTEIVIWLSTQGDVTRMKRTLASV